VNRYDPDRPSIFSKPDVESAPEPATPQSTRPPEPAPYGEDPTVIAAAWRPPRPPRTPRPGDTTEAPDDDREPISRQVIVLGSMGIAILALGGFIAASMLRPTAEPAVGVASAEPSASATAGAPSASARLAPSATEEPPPDATPEPTPAGPPQELAVDGWATVTVGELNVRGEPGLDASSVYRLVRGAIAHVAEGPASADGYYWYRIVSLGGARGWAAGGTEASPFMETLTDFDFSLQCGTVESAAWIEHDDEVEAADPIRIGSYALPAAAFDDFELGILHLLWGTGEEACFGTALDADREPTVYADIMAIACGHPERAGRGEAITLQPAPGQDVIVDYQVKRPTVVHGVLSSLAEGSSAGQNLRGVLEVATLDDNAHRCVHARSTEGPGSVDRFQQVDGHQCLIVDEWSDVIRLRVPGADAPPVQLAATGTRPDDVPLGSATGVYLAAYDSWPRVSPGLAIGPDLAGGCD